MRLVDLNSATFPIIKACAHLKVFFFLFFFFLNLQHLWLFVIVCHENLLFLRYI